MQTHHIILMTSKNKNQLVHNTLFVLTIGHYSRTIGKEINKENRTKSCVSSNGDLIGCFLLKRGTWQGDPKMRTFSNVSPSRK